MTMNVTGMRIGVTVLALGVGLLALPNLAEAQRAAGIARVGWLEVCGPGPRRPHFDMFRARLASQGYVEGKNLVIESRSAESGFERLPELAAELVGLKVDVIARHPLAKRSVARINSSVMPGLLAACPASFTTTSSERGHRLCSFHAPASGA
jgi:putative ABC transport system substrate-binding protein